MDLMSAGRLAWKHARNGIAEELYIHGNVDATRPTTVYGIVNERCNYKCRYCEYWRLPNYKEEMTIAEWQAALLSLKEFIGSYHVEFSGGEPFIKKGFVDLITWCHDNDIGWGVTSNGSGLIEKNIKRIVEARPFNFNISIDSHLPEIHNYTRGVPGSLEKITAGLRSLIQERARAGLDFPVIIKPVVHKLNFRMLPQVLEWAQTLGPTVVNFQPVDRWSKETYDELWLAPDEIPELERIAEELIRRKRAGAPIMNSETVLEAFGKHFREEKAPAEMLPCRVGLRNYFIRPDGDVEVCWFYPPIGNVKKQSAREVWASEEARLRRKETTACDRLCLFTCLSQKTITDKVKMGLTLRAGSKRKSNATAPASAVAAATATRAASDKPDVPASRLAESAARMR